MRTQNGLLIVATVSGLLACGCSSEPEGNYRHAKDGGSVADPSAGNKTGAVSLPDRPRQPVVAPKPGARQQPFETAITAAVGFGGAPVISDTSRYSAERRLPPAIGVASTLLLVSKVDRSLQNTSAIPEKKQKPRKIKLLIPERDFRKEGDAYRVTYDDLDLLKILNMEPVTPDAPKLMPDWLKNLDGQRIRIRGFMSPAYRSTGLRGFLMGRDNKACCFPGRAKIYDLFPVALKKGVTTHYIQNRPFDVVGTFQIKPWVIDGEILRIYRIVDARVIQ